MVNVTIYSLYSIHGSYGYMETSVFAVFTKLLWKASNWIQQKSRNTFCRNDHDNCLELQETKHRLSAGCWMMLDGDTGDAPPNSSAKMSRNHSCSSPKDALPSASMSKKPKQKQAAMADCLKSLKDLRIYIYICIYTYIGIHTYYIIYIIIQWFKQRENIRILSITLWCRDKGGLQGRNPPSSARPKRIGRATCRKMPRSVWKRNWRLTVTQNGDLTVIWWWFNGDFDGDLMVILMVI